MYRKKQRLLHALPFPNPKDSVYAISLLKIQEKAWLSKEEPPYHAYYFDNYVAFQAFLIFCLTATLYSAS